LRNGACIERLLRRDGIGRLALQDGVGVDKALDFGFDVVGGEEGNGQEQQRCQTAVHQSGQTEAASTTTSGNSLGRSCPSRRVATVRSFLHSKSSTSMVCASGESTHTSATPSSA